MTKELDGLIGKLRTLQASIDDMEEMKLKLRAELLELLKAEDIKSYKNDFGSVSFVERKTIKIKDRENVIQWIINKGLTNFLDVVPATDEHYELNKDFDDRIKKGLLEVDGVEVSVTELPQIKFN